ncbi:hypothetical protein [uncultured Pseudoteredinibacter sp.]|uniref:hypothetical protein n=1 Tax=uncultured Pseudoteredinibacter sp. TaxID=1641701 RepID=UPI0026019A56|nr:hypothetical protein [uncultured Pseudoteredinibacter sp.]
MDLDKWAGRIYEEEDFGKNIAISIAGIIGLTIYLIQSDFVLAAFITIIVFPPVKILLRHFESKYTKRREAERLDSQKKELVKVVENLTGQERRVIHEFVKYKSAVISNEYLSVNSIHMPDGATKSLRERGYLKVESYGTPQDFDLKLNIEIFEAGRVVFEN